MNRINYTCRAPAFLVMSVLGGAFLLIGRAIMADEVPRFVGQIERIEPEFDKLVPPDAKMEVLSQGHEWTEGPVWIADKKQLLFSDIPRNAIYRYRAGQVDVYMQPSGYTGKKPFTGREPGTNGLTLDAQGRLTMCCHGDRCVARIERDGSRTLLVDRYEGKRLNSPNDLVFHTNGDLYFTDPPYGLPEEPVRELDFCGVYRLSQDGQVTLLCDKMTRPNGIAFSPDYKTLYVSQSDSKAAIWNAFPVKKDGTLGEPTVLFDSTQWKGKRPGSPDGLKVDVRGNLWATGPGGVLVLSPKGKYLGRLDTGQRTANCAFGEDGSTLFICADMYLLRIELTTKGAGYRSPIP
jgi:gluconolactonase